MVKLKQTPVDFCSVLQLWFGWPIDQYSRHRCRRILLRVVRLAAIDEHQIYYITVRNTIYNSGLIYAD
jgi:hypothetical protein